ncbi:putative Calnexin like protein [Blattamonas nauphoetae]|uniref:Calnexin like protein n=1 Tax=Blattamonas nauphoetae TaxID=2049346 RepID=A0ABQ9YG86_9EUKA|nr:putative Calnexin like protein [Blattamonas nauphoetae]
MIPVIIISLSIQLFSHVYLQEEFDYTWRDRWVDSTTHEDEGKRGTFVWAAPEKKFDKEASKGIKTSEDSKFYHISRDIGSTFSSVGKTLIISYTVSHTQKLDCGGSYIKIFEEGFDQAKFSGDDQYAIMFGPDDCRSTNDKVHVILHKGGENRAMKTKIKTKNDKNTHLYTLIFHKNHSVEVRIDEHTELLKDMHEEWSYFPASRIRDSTAKQPSDWDDRPLIVDETDVKPADWDVPEYIETNTEKPADWDEEKDGKWIVPLKRNPLFKGEWKPKMIPNPSYSGGKWEQPWIDNPEIVDDTEKDFGFEKLRYVGIDVWQVQSGTIFDNIFIGDDLVEYEAFVNATWRKQHKVEFPNESTPKKKDDSKSAKKEEKKVEKKEKEGIPDDDEGWEWYTDRW